MTTSTKTPFELLGGAQGVRRLVERFYQLMDTLPEAARIRALHPADLAGSTDKLYKFLSGWLGGPALYVQEFGHPMLRAAFTFPDRNGGPRCVAAVHGTRAG